MASCCVIVKTYKDGRRELDDVPVPDDVVRVEPEGSDVQKMFRFVCLKQNKKLESCWFLGSLKGLFFGFLECFLSFS